MIAAIRLLLMWGMVLGLAKPGLAGAWLRQEGNGFLSTTGTAYRSDTGTDYRNSLYAEYGVMDSLTIGLDINDRATRSGHALAFLRLPLTQPAARNRLAVEFGFGAYHYIGRSRAMHRVTLSYGRGFVSGWGSGWIAVDAAIETRAGPGGSFRKLDFTAGMSADRRFNPLLQIETTYDGRDLGYWTATPAVLIRGKEGVRWLVGLEHRSANPQGTGLKFGFWRDF